MKKTKLTTILTIILMTSFVGCGSLQNKDNNTTNNVDVTLESEQNNITKEDSEIRNISEDDYYSVDKKDRNYSGIYLDENNNLMTSEDGKSLNKINVTNGATEEIVTTVNENFYIREFITNSNYIVWTEGDSNGFGTEHEKVIEWAIYNKNLATNEVTLIEKSKYNREDVTLKDYELYEPNALDISEENKLVYKGYDFDSSNNIISKINYYNLEDNTAKEIIKTKELMQEAVFEPKISGKNISFIKGTDYNDSSRLIFNNIDLYIYNLGNDSLEQVTENIPVSSSNIYSNKLVFSALNDDNEMVDSLYIYDINEKSMKNLLYKDSKAVSFLNDINLNNIKIGALDLDDKYVYIRIQGDYSPLIYNMVSKEFICVKDEIDSMLKNNLILVSKKDSRLLRIYVSSYEIEDTLLDYKLK